MTPSSAPRARHLGRAARGQIADGVRQLGPRLARRVLPEVRGRDVDRGGVRRGEDAGDRGRARVGRDASTTSTAPSAVQEIRRSNESGASLRPVIRAFWSTLRTRCGNTRPSVPLTRRNATCLNGVASLRLVAENRPVDRQAALGPVRLRVRVDRVHDEARAVRGDGDEPGVAVEETRRRRRRGRCRPCSSRSRGGAALRGRRGGRRPGTTSSPRARLHGRRGVRGRRACRARSRPRDSPPSSGRRCGRRRRSRACRRRAPASQPSARCARGSSVVREALEARRAGPGRCCGFRPRRRASRRGGGSGARNEVARASAASSPGDGHLGRERGEERDRERLVAEVGALVLGEPALGVLPLEAAVEAGPARRRGAPSSPQSRGGAGCRERDERVMVGEAAGLVALDEPPGAAPREVERARGRARPGWASTRACAAATNAVAPSARSKG